jgi:hypothetical protein
MDIIDRIFAAAEAGKGMKLSRTDVQDLVEEFGEMELALRLGAAIRFILDDDEAPTQH